MGLVWALGVGLAIAGIGTWAGCWYAPLLRTLNGIHPRWLGPAHAAAGAALLSVLMATAVTSTGTRATLLICAVDALVAG